MGSNNRVHSRECKIDSFASLVFCILLVTFNREYLCFGLAAILTETLYCVQIIQKNNIHME